jgi:hypothetical protein
MLTNDDLQKINNLLTPIKKQLNGKNNKIGFNFLDKSRIDHENRLDRIDTHLNLQPSTSQVA